MTSVRFWGFNPNDRHLLGDLFGKVCAKQSTKNHLKNKRNFSTLRYGSKNTIWARFKKYLRSSFCFNERAKRENFKTCFFCSPSPKFEVGFEAVGNNQHYETNAVGKEGHVDENRFLRAETFFKLTYSRPLLLCKTKTHSSGDGLWTGLQSHSLQRTALRLTILSANVAMNCDLF